MTDPAEVRHDDDAVPVSERRIPTLPEMSAWGREVATSYYGAGYASGYAAGWAAADEAAGARQRAAAAVVHAAAKRGSYADLAERRGEPERAERQRAILRERGIA